MIAVGLVVLQSDFHVSLAQASWLISSFYLAASVAQPLMGRLADRFGPRRVYATGLVIVGATGVLVLALRWLPADPPRSGARLSARDLVRDLDLPAVGLFAVTMLTLLDFVLSLGSAPLWVLLAVLPLTIGQLIWHERNEPNPFLDIRALGANRRLLGVLAQQAGV